MLLWDVIWLGVILYVYLPPPSSTSPSQICSPLSHPTSIVLLSHQPCLHDFPRTACHMRHRANHQEILDKAARASGTMIYATGTYGFYGYAYANLGGNYQFVHTQVKASRFRHTADSIRGTNKTDSPQKKVLTYPSFGSAFDLDLGSSENGGNPYSGLTRIAQKEANPWVSIGILGMSPSFSFSSFSFSLLRLLSPFFIFW